MPGMPDGYPAFVCEISHFSVFLRDLLNTVSLTVPDFMGAMRKTAEGGYSKALSCPDRMEVPNTAEGMPTRKGP